MSDYYSRHIQEMIDARDPYNDPATRHILRAHADAEKYLKDLTAIDDLYSAALYDMPVRDLAVGNAVSSLSIGSAVQRELATLGADVPSVVDELAKYDAEPCGAFGALSFGGAVQRDLAGIGSVVPSAVGKLLGNDLSTFGNAVSFEAAAIIGGTASEVSIGAVCHDVVAAEVGIGSALNGLSGMRSAFQTTLDNFNARIERIKNSFGESESRFFDSLDTFKDSYGSARWSSLIDQINTSLSKRKKKYVVALYDVERSIERQKNCGWLEFVHIDLRLRVLELSISCLSRLQANVSQTCREVVCFLINLYKGKPSQDGKSDSKVLRVAPAAKISLSYFLKGFLCQIFPKNRSHWPGRQMNFRCAV